MTIIIPANSAVGGGFDVANSLRTNRGSSDYLSRTNGSAGNRRTFTISYWMKIAQDYSVAPYIFGTATSSTNIIDHYYSNTGAITIEAYTGSWTLRLTSDPLLRDLSAWYHICYAVDTTQGTEANRVKLYINGVQSTFNSSPNKVFPSQNLELPYNQDGGGVRLNCQAYHNAEFMGAYYSEFCMIDGSALAPTSFGEFDEDSGIWKPISVSGLTFGTNGFYLDFEDSSALGNDAAGSNNFTVNNLTAIDQTTDTCTNNFCTMNPLDTYNSPTITSGNTICNAGGSDKAMRSTIGISSGKWYWEVNTTANNSANMGIINGEAVLTDGNSLQSVSTNSVIWEGNGGLLFKNGSSVTTAYSGGTSTYGFALDLDNGTLKLSQNGTFYNSGNAVVTSITADTYLPFFAPNGGGSPTEFKANFGNPAYAISSSNTDGNGYGNFEYAVPSGYYSLNTKNLAEYG